MTGGPPVRPARPAGEPGPLPGDPAPLPGDSAPLIPSLPNLRDVGGHPTADGGRVRTGLLYRSTDLSRLDDAGAAALETLGIRTVFDLRTAGERAGGPDRLPPGAASSWSTCSAIRGR